MKRKSKAIIAVMVCLFSVMLALIAIATWIIAAPSKEYYPKGENRKKIYVNRFIELDYGSTQAERTVSKDGIGAKLDFRYEDGTPVVNGDGNPLSLFGTNSVYFASNGNVEYYSNQAITVGSTYSWPIQINLAALGTDASSLYEFAGTYGSIENGHLKDISAPRTSVYGFQEIVLIKYKTVQIGSTIDTSENAKWYTIEDALKTAVSGNTVCLVGDDSKIVTPKASDADYAEYKDKYDKNFVKTSFSKLESDMTPYGDDSYRTVQSGVSLFLPAWSEDSTDNMTSKITKAYSEVYTKTTAGLYSVLMIPSDVSLTVNGNLYVGGARVNNTNPACSYTNKQRGYSELEVEGSITLEKDASLMCYGFTFGGGGISAKSGSTVIEPFNIYGWKGGSVTAAIYKNVFPLNQYDLANIETKITFANGSNYNVRAALATNGDPYDETISFISGTTNSFIRIVGANATICKWVDANTGKAHLQSNGNITFSNMSFSVSLSVSGFDLVTLDMTTYGFQVPIPGNIVIEVASGEAVVPSGVSLKLLPGAEAIVRSGATLTVQSGGSVYSYGAGGFSGQPWHYVANKKTIGYNYDPTDYGDTIHVWQDGDNGVSYLPTAALSASHRIAPTGGFNYSTKEPAKVYVEGTVNINGGATMGATVGGTHPDTKTNPVGKLNLNGNLSGLINEDLTRNGNEFSGSDIASAILSNALTNNTAAGNPQKGTFTLSEYFHAAITSYGVASDDETLTPLSGGEWKYLEGAWRGKATLSVIYDTQGGSFDDSSFTNPHTYSEYYDWQTTKVDLPFAKVPSVSRAYYTFLGWCTDPDGNGTLYNDTVIPVKIGEENKLYAIWKPIEYTVEYVVYGDDFKPTAEDYTLIFPNGATLATYSMWTIESILDFTGFEVKAENSALVFNGWYNNASFGVEESELSRSTIDDFTIVGNKIIVYGWIGATAIYDIEYVYSRPTEDGGATNYAVGRGDELQSAVDTKHYPNVDEKHINQALIDEGKALETNRDRMYYFLGWFDEGGNPVSPGSRIQSTMDANNDGKIVLEARWERKVSVTFSDTTAGFTFGRYYYMPGTEFNNADIGYTLAISKDYDVGVGTYFGGWKDDLGNMYGDTVNGTWGYYRVPDDASSKTIAVTAQRAGKVSVTIVLDTSQYSIYTPETPGFYISYQTTQGGALTEQALKSGKGTYGPYWLKPNEQEYKIVFTHSNTREAENSGRVVSQRKASEDIKWTYTCKTGSLNSKSQTLSPTP